MKHSRSDIAFFSFLFVLINAWGIYVVTTNAETVVTPGYTTVQEDGVSLPRAKTLNIAGSAATCSGTTSKTTCTFTGGAGGGQVNSVVAGTNITVDSTDPANPIVSSLAGGATTTTLPFTAITGSATDAQMLAHSGLTGSFAHGDGTMSTQDSDNVVITGGTISTAATISAAKLYSSGNVGIKTNQTATAALTIKADGVSTPFRILTTAGLEAVKFGVGGSGMIQGNVASDVDTSAFQRIIPTAVSQHHIALRGIAAQTGDYFQINSPSSSAHEGDVFRIKAGGSVLASTLTLTGQLTASNVTGTNTGDQNLASAFTSSIASWAGSANITTLGTIATGTIPYSLITGTPVSAQSLTCNVATQKFYAYNSVSGLFTCGTDSTSTGGGGGDMYSATYDPAGYAVQLATLSSVITHTTATRGADAHGIFSMATRTAADYSTTVEAAGLYASIAHTAYTSTVHGGVAPLVHTAYTSTAHSADTFFAPIAHTAYTSTVHGGVAPLVHTAYTSTAHSADAFFAPIAHTAYTSTVHGGVAPLVHTAYTTTAHGTDFNLHTSYTSTAHQMAGVVASAITSSQSGWGYQTIGGVSSQISSSNSAWGYQTIGGVSSQISSSNSAWGYQTIGGVSSQITTSINAKIGTVTGGSWCTGSMASLVTCTASAPSGGGILDTGPSYTVGALMTRNSTTGAYVTSLSGTGSVRVDNGLASVIATAATLTCGGTDKISAYNAASGIYTCSTDQTAVGGSGVVDIGPTYTAGTILSRSGTTGAFATTLTGTGTLSLANSVPTATTVALAYKQFHAAAHTLTSAISISSKLIEVTTDGDGDTDVLVLPAGNDGQELEIYVKSCGSINDSFLVYGTFVSGASYSFGMNPVGKSLDLVYSSNATAGWIIKAQSNFPPAGMISIPTYSVLLSDVTGSSSSTPTTAMTWTPPASKTVILQALTMYKTDVIATSGQFGWISGAAQHVGNCHYIQPGTASSISSYNIGMNTEASSLYTPASATVINFNRQLMNSSCSFTTSATPAALRLRFKSEAGTPANTVTVHKGSMIWWWELPL